MITEFVLVRHGETLANAEGILQGHLQTDLNENGIRQAHLAGRGLADEHFDLVVSSDLNRAFITAKIIISEIGKEIPLEPTAELREWNLGDFQGKTVRHINEKYPHVLDSFRYEGDDFAIPGGEHRSDFYGRVYRCLDRLAAEHEGKKILLVSHGGCLKAIFKKIAGSPAFPNTMLPMTSNASISRFSFRDGYWILHSWNETNHLKTVSLRESVTF